MIRTGAGRKTILLIGAETMSRLLDWSDRTTCVLFGDGAGAAVLQAHEGVGTNRRIRAYSMPGFFSDGRLHDMLYADGGVRPRPRTTGKLRMQGNEVFKHAVTNIAAAIEPLLREAAASNSAGRDRLVRAASGQPAHSGRNCEEAGHTIQPTCDLHRRPAWQHLRGLGAAGAGGQRSGMAASSRETWCFWKPWAAALLGAPLCSGGRSGRPCRSPKLAVFAVLACPLDMLVPLAPRLTAKIPRASPAPRIGPSTSRY